MSHRRPVIAVLGVAAVLALLWWQPWAGAAKGPLRASGTIEATRVALAAETAGRLRWLGVKEGDRVAAGQLVAALDDSTAAAQVGLAEAALRAAQTDLTRLRAGARPEEITEARAVVAQAAARRDGAKAAYDNAVKTRDNPQELIAAIDEVRAQIVEAEAAIEQARVAGAVAAANREANRWRTTNDGTELLDSDENKARYAFFDGQYQAAQAAMAAAEATRDGLRRQLAELDGQRQNPIELKARVDSAQAAYLAASAAADAAQARLTALLHGATEHDIAIAEAQVAEAQAAVEVARVQQRRSQIASPLDGIVSQQTIRVGELVEPGATLLVVQYLDEVELKVYVPEAEIGRVALGQAVAVSVDSWPSQSFAGRVSWIASRVEFTPRNVQTQRERVNTVFAVKVRLANPEGRLKPGMPADARFD